MKKKIQDSICHCGGLTEGASYDTCCRPVIEASVPPISAEQLMRSRYTAYTQGNRAYVLSSWHESTRPTDLILDLPGTPHGTQWLGLHIHSHTRLTETQAQVMFTARYREAGRAHRIKEHSRFVLENGYWLYLDGEIEPAQ